MATHATVWTGILSNAATSLTAGYAVVKNGSVFLPATSANRTSYGRSVGIAITSADTSNPAFEYQVAGVVDASLTGLGAGTATWVIVSSTGTLERDDTPDSGEDVVGKCNTAGDLYVHPGVFDSGNYAGGGGGGGATLPIDLTTDVTGVLPTANQAAQTMGGDVGGTTAASTITNLAVTKLAVGTKSYVLESFDSGSGAAVRWGLRDRPTIANTGTGTLDDVATTDANGNQAEIIRWTGDNASNATITSLAGPTQSRVVLIINAATGDPCDLTLSDSAGTGTAANRILCPGNTALVVKKGFGAILRYDTTDSRWRVIGGTAYTEIVRLDLQDQLDNFAPSVAIGDITGLGTGVATFLGTPSGANLASALTTALPASKGGTGLTSLGSGVATMLGTFSSANIAAACSDETGTAGNLVFSTNPSLTSPTISSPVISGTPQYNGTRVTKKTVIAEVQTSSTTQTTCGSYTMTNETLVAFEILVTCARRTNVTKGGRYKRSVVYRRTSSGSPTIVGSLESGTDQESTAGDDVTIDVSSNDVRVRVTAADTDGRNWTTEIYVTEQTAA